jgi:tRNA(fMet)-specific endonuclease VapC
MSLYLLDSGIIIDVLNGKRRRQELTQQLPRQSAILASCPTTIIETYAGLRPEEWAKTNRFLTSLKFFPLTWEISKQAGGLLCYWRG